MNSGPTATYCQRGFGSTVVYELFPHELRVSGRSLLGSSFETHVPLSALYPRHGRVRGAPQVTNCGMLIFTVMLVAFIVARQFQLPFLGATSISILVIGCGGLVWGLLTLRPREWVTIQSKDGQTAIHIGGFGPEADRLPGFVEQLESQIARTQSAASTAVDTGDDDRAPPS